MSTKGAESKQWLRSADAPVHYPADLFRDVGLLLLVFFLGEMCTLKLQLHKQTVGFVSSCQTFYTFLLKRPHDGQMSARWCFQHTPASRFRSDLCSPPGICCTPVRINKNHWLWIWRMKDHGHQLRGFSAEALGLILSRKVETSGFFKVLSKCVSVKAAEGQTEWLRQPGCCSAERRSDHLH